MSYPFHRRPTHAVVDCFLAWGYGKIMESRPYDVQRDSEGYYIDIDFSDGAPEPFEDGKDYVMFGRTKLQLLPPEDCERIAGLAKRRVRLTPDQIQKGGGRIENYLTVVLVAWKPSRLRKFLCIPSWLVFKAARPFLPRDHAMKTFDGSLANWERSATPMTIQFGMVMWFVLLASIHLYHSLR